MKCPKCNSNKISKNGIEPSNKKQRYLCKVCRKGFYDNYAKYKIMNEHYKNKTINLYTEGMSMRAIGRILGFSHQTIFCHLKKNRKSIF